MHAVAPASAASTSPALHRPLAYEFHAARLLPCIDTTKCVKHVVFRPSTLRLFNQFSFRGRHGMGICYWVGVALAAATLFVPSHQGKVLAIICGPLQIVPTIVALLLLRYDMAKLLLKTYEFWFLTLTNVFVCTCIALTFNDWRCLVSLSGGIAFEVAVLIDANFRATRAVVFGSAFGAIVNVSYVVGATFRMIHNAEDITLFAYKQHELLADDAVVNMLSTMLLLVMRNAYRKHKTAGTTAARETRNATVFITYRCRVVLRPVTTATATEPPQSQPLPLPGKGLRRLQLVPVDQRFHPQDVVFPWRWRWTLVLPSWWHSVAVSSSLVCVATTSVATNAMLISIASYTAICCAFAVFCNLLTVSNRQLLWRLLGSFDFVFLSIQLSITHACLADIIGWRDLRSLSILSLWLLLHWVLLLDTVLPVHKTSRLGSGKPATVAAAVLSLYIVEQLFVLVSLVFIKNPHINLADHTVFTLTLRGFVKQTRVVPLLFGRQVTTLSWSFRLLWRLWDHKGQDDELLMLQGQVQDKYEPHIITPSGKKQNTTDHPSQ